VSPYATADDLLPWCAHFGVAFPDDAARLLDLATRDVQRHLGAAWVLSLVDADQRAALVMATAIQAAWRAGQGADSLLGLDDGVSSIGGMSFSVRSAPRFSPQASELLSGLGLFARSGTVAPEVAIVPLPPAP